LGLNDLPNFPHPQYSQQQKLLSSRYQRHAAVPPEIFSDTTTNKDNSLPSVFQLPNISAQIHLNYQYSQFASEASSLSSLVDLSYPKA